MEELTELDERRLLEEEDRDERERLQVIDRASLFELSATRRYEWTDKVIA